MKHAVTIYHNPRCGTSRNTLALIRNAGIEPEVIEYLKDTPDVAALRNILQRAAISARDLLRAKESICTELKLDDPNISEHQLLEAMSTHPVLINRPIVVTELGVRLCRPSEQVLDILPTNQQGAFTKEDGEAIIDAEGRRLR